MAISFTEFLLGHCITELVLYVCKTFVRPQFKRVTGKDWPNWQAGLYRIVLNAVVMLLLAATHHTGLALLNLTIVEKSLPNTCDACIAAKGAKGQAMWPCQRDAMYEWTAAAASGHIGLWNLVQIAMIRNIVVSCIVAVAWHLFATYFKVGKTSATSSAVLPPPEKGEPHIKVE
ncbi:hypothetical protein PRZ48_014657 [Zasmidium cellare]|uniref:Uncharacterized protein n=1 Tax=Zasmidium cellare TaxID=395010 RepID=A0ABR0DYX5_ZASCE|nr:hypothetical protein PRZ48_014657 [Zasmidium cellare]